MKTTGLKLKQIKNLQNKKRRILLKVEVEFVNLKIQLDGVLGRQWNVEKEL